MVQEATVHSFDKHLFSVFYIAGNVPDGDIEMNKINLVLDCSDLHFSEYRSTINK